MRDSVLLSCLKDEVTLERFCQQRTIHQGSGEHVPPGVVLSCTLAISIV